jgi:hypothetical protein
MTQKHLAQAPKHVALGEKHIARQREIVSEFERDGHQTIQARDPLKPFEDTQVEDIAYRDQLDKRISGRWGEQPAFRSERK